MEDAITLVKSDRATLGSDEARVAQIAEILADLKAEDICALDLKGICDFTDFFVIATVRSAPQMRAAAEQIADRLKADGVRPFAPPDLESPNWSVLDYGHIVVHLFRAETRAHYRLEELWGDARQVLGEDEATA